MSWTLTTSGKAIAKAGTNVNSKFEVGHADWDDDMMAGFSDDVEGSVCMKTRRDWINNAGGTVIMSAISDLTSDLIAIKMIEFDMSGYVKGEAQTMLDVLTTNSDTVIKDLREKKNQVLNE